MKKIFITMVFVVAAMVGQAQLFLGGNFATKFSGGSTEFTLTSPSINDYGIDYSDRGSYYEFSPIVGYMFSEKMGFGLHLTTSIQTVKKCTNHELPEFNDKTRIFHYGFAPFFRYVFADFGKLRMLADVKVPITFAQQKHIFKDEDTVIEDDVARQFNFGSYIVPAFIYDLTDHISFTAELGVLSLGIVHSRITVVEENGDITTEYVQKSHEYGIGINNEASLSVGFIYTF